VIKGGGIIDVPKIMKLTNGFMKSAAGRNLAKPDYFLAK
jgi:hypothetical protein